MRHELHAIVYKSETGSEWVATCIEYDITSQGDSERHALQMLQEAVEFHLENISRDELAQISNEVGSEPVVKTFAIRAPAILD